MDIPGLASRLVGCQNANVLFAGHALNVFATVCAIHYNGDCLFGCVLPFKVVLHEFGVACRIDIILIVRDDGSVLVNELGKVGRISTMLFAGLHAVHCIGGGRVLQAIRSHSIAIFFRNASTIIGSLGLFVDCPEEKLIVLRVFILSTQPLKSATRRSSPLRIHRALGSVKSAGLRRVTFT